MNEKCTKIDLPYVRLAEECSEVIKCCMKIERFGIQSYHPKTNISNIQEIRSEMQDLSRCMRRVKAIIKKEEIKQLKNMIKNGFMTVEEFKKKLNESVKKPKYEIVGINNKQ